MRSVGLVGAPLAAGSGGPSSLLTPLELVSPRGFSTADNDETAELYSPETPLAGGGDSRDYMWSCREGWGVGASVGLGIATG